ncbi:MAG: hypothetical protein K5678_01680, partial [Acetatifactor sp.]|nr:hypothetical protein [Acetatifactor sp.]
LWEMRRRIGVNDQKRWAQIEKASIRVAPPVSGPLRDGDRRSLFKPFKNELKMPIYIFKDKGDYRHGRQQEDGGSDHFHGRGFRAVVY